MFCNHGPISGRTLNEIPSKNRVEHDDIKACPKSKKWQTTTSGRRVKEKKGKKGEKKENVGFESRGTEVPVHLAVLMDARFPIHLTFCPGLLSCIKVQVFLCFRISR